MAESSEAQQHYPKRDFLRQIEKEAQEKWGNDRLFDADADPAGRPKYFVTFPYPYMNGRLHLGHTFTITKAEYTANYQRLKGKHAIFPLSFHCTGMPIKACADKLKGEISKYGIENLSKPDWVPPEILAQQAAERAAEEAEEAARDKAKSEKAQKAADKGKGDAKQKPKKEAGASYHAAKSKVAAKSGGFALQWRIMQSMDIPNEEIPQFTDAAYWLRFFPPWTKKDLTDMGCGIDWRRSFITTDANPYYEAFVRWQFITLRKLGKVQFGKRYCIYSPLDGQACADHDRASGEGVNPQDYTLIKMKLLSPFPDSIKHLEGKDVFLVPATLRPETMYGQTNCWILPSGTYGIFQAKQEIFICADRAANNMAYQELFEEFGKVVKLGSISGQELLGRALSAPLAKYDKVYTLPMLSISMEKGTGIVTSVPSDSPDDFAALRDLKNKPDFRKKFGITDEMVLPYDVVPIINIPGELGTNSAEVACKMFRVNSQNDREQLAEAKDLVYKKGFSDGVMVVGDCAGTPVKDAKPVIRDMLVQKGLAVPYSEPESKVVSRSGEECVVGLTDQWYLPYGETEWLQTTKAHLDTMELYSAESQKRLQDALERLHQWACSRTYGLGTRLPWDEQYLIESLSDSTIYMAFYTVAHLLQGGDYFGQTVGPAGIKPEQLTPPVFDYIFFGATYPADSGIPEDTLKSLRQEFEYWYPVNLRVSGKDLIQNHLIFFLYNHTALFPKDKWPLGIRPNGHVLLNSKKMSKSTGNFLSLSQAIERYSADGMRLALADAGDGIDDANFAEETANKAVLRLFTMIEWMSEVIDDKVPMRDSDAPYEWMDQLFDAEIDKAIEQTEQHYEKCNFRFALKSGFFDLQNARDLYRAGTAHINMKRDITFRYLEVQTILLAPITPHVCEYIWKKLGKPGSVRFAKFPTGKTPDAAILDQGNYLQSVLHNFRTKRQLAESQLEKKAKREKLATVPVLDTAIIHVAKDFPDWQQKIITIVKSKYDRATKTLAPDADIAAAFRADAELKTILKKAMPVYIQLKAMVEERGPSAMELSMSFDETKLLQTNVAYLADTLKVQNLKIFDNKDPAAEDPQQKKDSATPGQPVITFL